MAQIVQEDMWGKIETAYLGFSNDANIRNMASSGGILTEVACYLLKNKIVDYVVQSKVSKDNPLRTEIIYSKTLEDVISCCGSRYTASAPLLDLIEKLQRGKKYAIIGKPCDIQVLRKYINLHKELQKSIIYLISFFCAGTPSYQANLNLLNKLRVKEADVQQLTYRGNDWPGKTSVLTKEGKIVDIEYEESWCEILGRDLQNICRFCWDGIGEAADISCGDGWYIENGKPVFDENNGRNIIFARTSIGNQLLKKMEGDRVISLEKLDDLSIMREMQPNHYMRKAVMFSRILAMRLCFKTTPQYSLRQLYKYSKLLSKKQNIKVFAGTIRRIIQNKV